MNSLSQLNSLASITFDDQRTPDVIFDRPIAMNQSVISNQNDNHYIPIGINIVEIANASLASVTYEINIIQQPDATLTWASLPSGVSVSNTTAGIYTVIGIDSVSDWEAVKSPLFQPDATFTGIFSYTATISWVGGSKTWTVDMNILDITNMTVASDFPFNKNTTGTITGNPTILDNYSTTWTVRVTPSNITYINTLSSAGTGGTTSFNATTKVLTITGTKTQVNSHMNSISYQTTVTATEDFTLGYVAINDTTNEGDYKVQNWTTLEYLALTRANDAYSLNTQAAVTNGPLITDASYDGSGNYIMTITPTVPAAVYSLASEGKYYWPLQGTTNVAGLSNGYLEVYWAATSDLSKYAVSDSTSQIVSLFSRDSVLSASIDSNKIQTSFPFVPTIPNDSKIIISGTAAGTPPTGYTNPKTYYIRDVVLENVQEDPLTSFFSFNISETRGGSAISLTGVSLSGLTLTIHLPTLLQTFTGVGATGGEFGNHFTANSDLTLFAISARGETGAVAPAGGRGAIYIKNAAGTTSVRIPSPSSSDYFRGAYMNPAGTTVAVYAYSGSDAWVYIYDLVSSTWTLSNTFQGATWEFGKPLGNGYDKGGMVFIDDTTLAVGDVRESNYTGTVSIYKKSGSTWSLNVKLTNPTATTYHFFGKIIKVNSSTEIEIWADAPDLFQSYRKHIYSLVSGTWTFTSTTAVSYANKSAYQIIPASTTTDGEFRVAYPSQIYRNTGSGFVPYSTLSTSSDTSFQAVISATGEYIFGHRAMSSSLKYVSVFKKTANDPNASSWNATTKTLTIQGTREFINSEIDTIQLIPADAYNTNIVLTYTLTTPRGDTDSRTQTITYTP